MPYLACQWHMDLSHRDSQSLTNAGSVLRLGRSVWTQVDAPVAPAGVLAVLVGSAHVLATLVHVFIKEHGMQAEKMTSSALPQKLYFWVVRIL